MRYSAGFFAFRNWKTGASGNISPGDTKGTTPDRNVIISADSTRRAKRLNCRALILFHNLAIIRMNPIVRNTAVDPGPRYHFTGSRVSADSSRVAESINIKREAGRAQEYF